MWTRFLLLLICFVGLAAACLPIQSASTPDSTGPIVVTEIPSGDRVEVDFVIDGDTIEVVSNGRSYRVRYIGVDTPERGEPFYDEATQVNRQLVAGQEVVLVKDVSETDQYGRLLRYVYLSDGTFVNAELVRQGYARIVTFPPDVAQQAFFQELQTSAREAQRGLWALSELADPAAPAGCFTCDRNALNCADYNTQASAQACYDYCLAQTGTDVHKLDGGGDGVVCESLP